MRRWQERPRRTARVLRTQHALWASTSPKRQAACKIANAQRWPCATHGSGKPKRRLRHPIVCARIRPYAWAHSTKHWQRRRRATANASSRSARRARTAAWPRARRAHSMAAQRVRRATTATTCRVAPAYRSRTAAQGRRSRRTAQHRQARAWRVVQTSTRTPQAIATRHARRSRDVALAS